MAVIRARLLGGAALLFGLAAESAAAQAIRANEDSPPRWEVGAYVGVARNSPAGTHLGAIPDRDHLFIGVHPTAALVRRRAWTLRYAPEVVPLLLISNNPKYRTLGTFNGRKFVIEEGTGPVAGFAVSPIGLETDVTFATSWRAYAASAVGGVWFTRDVPVRYSRAFNFTFEVGGGLQWRSGRRNWLRVGYKFHHLSNLFTAPQNPGIDGKVFLVGFAREVGRR